MRRVLLLLSKVTQKHFRQPSSIKRCHCALRGGYGALPRCLRTTPQQSRPLKRAPCTPPKLRNGIPTEKEHCKIVKVPYLCNVATLQVAILFFGQLPIPLTAFLHRPHVQRFLCFVKHSFGYSQTLCFLKQGLLQVLPVG